MTIDVGGYENKIEEVYNTINILGEIIGEIIPPETPVVVDDTAEAVDTTAAAE